MPECKVIEMETEEKISIVMGVISMSFPNNAVSIKRMRKLLDVFEDYTDPGARPHQDMLDLAVQAVKDVQGGVKVQTPIESPPDNSCASTQKGTNISQPEAKPISTGERGQVDTQTSNQAENPAERKDEAIASIPEELSSPKFELIPKFAWDKTKEKSYRTIFFIELEDGRVMISYFSSKVFTTKEAIMAIPFPIPRIYAPLMNLNTNPRTAVRQYREYLAKEAEAQRSEIAGAGEHEEKGAAGKREESLRQKAEVNKTRWEEKPKKEMSARTRELQRNVVAKMLV